MKNSFRLHVAYGVGYNIQVDETLSTTLYINTFFDILSLNHVQKEWLAYYIYSMW